MLEKKKFIILLIFLLIVISSSVVAQDVSRAPRLNFNGITGDDFIGQAGLLYPFRNTEDSLWFTDLRYRMSSDDIDEWNLGLGYRKKLDNYDNRIAGAYIFKDRRNEYDHDWDMWTVGGELLTDQWDFRINGYLTDDEKIDAPQNDEIIVKNQKLYYQEGFLSSMNGLDFEVGKRFVSREDWLKNTGVYLKLFSFFEDNADTMYGHQLRIDKQFGDLNKTTWNLGARWRDDDVRGSETELTFAVSIPFGKGKSEDTGDIKSSEEIVEARMTEQPERDLDIVVAESDDPDLQEAKNLDGSSLGDVIFVSADGTGDGSSKSNPTNIIELNTLAGEGDVIIFMGDDGKINAGYMLMNGQKLLSAAGKLVLASENLDKKAKFIPDVKQAVLDNGTDDVLILADDTMISGLEFDGGETAIYGDGISGEITITNNVIDNVYGAGIMIESENVKSLLVNKNTVNSSESDGIYIDVGTIDQEGDNIVREVSDNLVDVVSSASGIVVYTRAKNNTTIVKSNTVNNVNDYGYYINTDGYNNETIIDSNYIDITNDFPFSIITGSSDTNTNITKILLNSVNESDYYGFKVYSEGISNTTTLQENAVNYSGDNGYHINTSGDYNITTLKSNTVDYSNQSGFNIDTYGNTENKTIIESNYVGESENYYGYRIITGHHENTTKNNITEIISNKVDYAYDYGFEIDIYGDNISTLVESNFVAKSEDADGLNISSGYLSTINNKTIVNSNTVNSARNDGIQISMRGDNNTATMNSNILKGSSDGLVFSVNSGDITANIENNIFTDNKSNGMYISIGSTYIDNAEFILSGNTIINNNGNGIRVLSSTDNLLVDLGGGSLGSNGNNIIYGNEGYQVDNNSGSKIKAENNWWNQIPDDTLFSGDIIYTPYLEEEPNN